MKHIITLNCGKTHGSLTHRDIKKTLTSYDNQGLGYLSIWNLRDYCGCAKLCML
ncbi:MAG: hypothetical protein KJ706_02005 [Candidatus Omnitrophica bacterium]|nr:hypothetical protein [Candidatus Omnitrophota bacterium]